jgi:hypothetical protein
MSAKIEGMALFRGCFLLALPLLAAPRAPAAGLTPETLRAWDAYLVEVAARTQAAAAGESGFLQIEMEDLDSKNALEKLRGGEVLVWRPHPGRSPAVPHGLIHDWAGAIFVPGATLDAVLAMERDYARYPQRFGPTIVRANLMESAEGLDRFTLRYKASALLVTVVLDAEYEAQYYPLDATRTYSVTRSLRLREIHKMGRSEENEPPPGDAGAYMWRIYGIAKYWEKDDGVYIEQESIGLSRSIPASLQWLVEPAARRLAKDLLRTSLVQARDAVLRKSGE